MFQKSCIQNALFHFLFGLSHCFKLITFTFWLHHFSRVALPALVWKTDITPSWCMRRRRVFNRHSHTQLSDCCLQPYRGICLPVSSINPHFPGLLRFNSHQSIWGHCTQSHTLRTHTPQYHWKKVDAYTPFQSLCRPLRILLGRPLSIHEFRNIFYQLAVRTQQVSLQHKSKVKGQYTTTAGELRCKSIARPCIVIAQAVRSF